MFGAYSIGKERVFMEVARQLREPVCVSKAKMKLMSCFNWPLEIMVTLCSPCHCALARCDVVTGRHDRDSVVCTVCVSSVFDNNRPIGVKVSRAGCFAVTVSNRG